MATYFEINYADEPSEQRKLLSMLWQLVHAVAKRAELKYDVSFPFWMDPVKDDKGAILKSGTFGPVMRVFADTATLETMRNEVCAHRLVASGLVAVSEMRPVPPHATVERFVRSRHRDRVTAAHAAAHLRHLQVCAAKGKLRDYELIPAALMRNVARAKENFVAMRSSGSQRPFSLNVERLAADSAATHTNSYGLGRNVPRF